MMFFLLLSDSNFLGSLMGLLWFLWGKTYFSHQEHNQVVCSVLHEVGGRSRVISFTFLPEGYGNVL